MAVKVCVTARVSVLMTVPVAAAVSKRIDEMAMLLKFVRVATSC